MVPKFGRRGKTQEGWKVRVVEGHSKEKLFLPDRLQPLCEELWQGSNVASMDGDRE